MKVKFDLNSFDIDTSQKNFTDGKGNSLITSTLETIISFITVRYFYNEFETIYIHSDLFKKLSGDYRQYLNYLKAKGIIIIDESYKKGVIPKGYMFTDYFKAFATIREIKLDSRDRFEEKVQKIYVDIDPMVKERVSMDFSSLCIKQMPVEKEIMFHKDDGIPVVSFRTYLSDVINLYRLQTKTVTFKLNAGRFFNPFTQLSSKVRESHIYFEEKLVNLDIKNSFSMWLAVWLIGKGMTIDYETNEFFNEIQSGKFYWGLIDKFNNAKDLFNNTEDEKPRMTKLDVKQHFMSWLNGDNKRNNLPNYVFRAYYPKVFDFISQYKADRKDTMYYELVKMETQFIFNTVCKRLYESIPDIKILTCHDQIYFEERYMNQVRPIWEDEICKIHALIPVVPEIQFDKADLEYFGIEIDCF